MAIAPCGTPTITTGVVVFDQAEFVAMLPEFTGVSLGALQMNFTQATLLLNNSCGSLVEDANQRQVLLYLLTGHITKLFTPVAGQATSDVVGRVSDASQGSVSITAEYASQISQSMAYFVQTKYGAQYWAMTAQYRTMKYYVPPERRDGFGPYGGRFGINGRRGAGPGGYGDGGGNCGGC